MLTRIVQPAIEPVTLDEAKLHLRVDFAEDDVLIGGLITAAREACEHQVWRSFIATTWRHSVDSFPYGYQPGIPLPVADVLSTVQLTYIDANGTQRTIAASGYWLTSGPPSFLYPSFGTTWPSAYDQQGAVTVDFTAGYGTAPNLVPEVAKIAIKLLVGDMYEHREQSSEVQLYRVPTSVRWLLASLDWGGTRV